MADENPMRTTFDDTKHSRKELRDRRIARKSAAKRRPIFVIDPAEVRSLLVGSQTVCLSDEGLDKLWTIFMFLMKQRERAFPPARSRAA